MVEYRSLSIQFTTFKEKLGEGAFGEVFKVKERGGKARTLAVKIITCTHNQELQSAVEEITALVALQHTNIVKMFDFGLSQEWELEVKFKLVLEYCSNGSLKDQLSERNSRRQKIRWMKSITSAVVYLHSQSIIHQDIKPDNILLSANGVIKVADFGLSQRFARRDEHQTWRSYYINQGVGALCYVAPEMLADRHTYKVDIFSMGILFHALLEGDFIVEDDGKRCYGVFVKTRKQGKQPIGFEMHQKGSELRVPFRGRRKRLIERMLKYEPKQRPTAEEVEGVLRSTWRRFLQLSPIIL